MTKEKMQKIVKEAYGKIAQGETGCGCGCSTCGTDATSFAENLGYSAEELAAIPTEANLALSCGNPFVFAELKEGETVLDLGSGAGFDCFLAAKKVGKTGKVIGVDMTPEMIRKAQDNARKNQIKNVEFKLGEIENLPVESNSVDLVISNCVINLSIDKPKVFQEIYRVLKPGGRIAISDIALSKEPPQKIRESIEAYVGCISGAMLLSEYQEIITAAGFKNVNVISKTSFSCVASDTKDPLGKAILDSLDKNESLENFVVSVVLVGWK
ncbi:MAG: arsenite methyltransferase [Candidatus Margulisiibacteriota bacterium]|jgi:SAM-dependent methyltransferase